MIQLFVCVWTQTSQTTDLFRIEKKLPPPPPTPVSVFVTFSKQTGEMFPFLPECRKMEATKLIHPIQLLITPDMWQQLSSEDKQMGLSVCILSREMCLSRKVCIESIQTHGSLSLSWHLLCGGSRGE